MSLSPFSSFLNYSYVGKLSVTLGGIIMLKGVDYMPFDWNRIIRFCGWWLELFGTKLCMLAISYCRFWDCISIFFVHLSTDSVIPGAKGGTSIFLDLGIFCCSFHRFYANSHNLLIFLMGHYWSYLFCHRHSMSLLRLIVTEFFGQTS